MFANMAAALIKHEQIVTTLPKAKDLRPIVEKLVTLGKRGDLHARRQAIAEIRDVARSRSSSTSSARATRTATAATSGCSRRASATATRRVAVIEFVDRDEEAKGLDSGRVERRREGGSGRRGVSTACQRSDCRRLRAALLLCAAGLCASFSR